MIDLSISNILWENLPFHEFSDKENEEKLEVDEMPSTSNDNNVIKTCKKRKRNRRKNKKKKSKPRMNDFNACKSIDQDEKAVNQSNPVKKIYKDPKRNNRNNRTNRSNPRMNGSNDRESIDEDEITLDEFCAMVYLHSIIQRALILRHFPFWRL